LVIPVLKWVRGEPLSQDNWVELFCMIGLPKSMTLDRLTFGDLIAHSDAIINSADALKVMCAFWLHFLMHFFFFVALLFFCKYFCNILFTACVPLMHIMQICMTENPCVLGLCDCKSSVDEFVAPRGQCVCSRCFRSVSLSSWTSNSTHLLIHSFIHSRCLLCLT